MAAVGGGLFLFVPVRPSLNGQAKSGTIPPHRLKLGDGVFVLYFLDHSHRHVNAPRHIRGANQFFREEPQSYKETNNEKGDYFNHISIWIYHEPVM